MNYFFFLNPPFKEIEAELEIVNSSPSSVYSISKPKDLILHYFYSNGKEWIFKDICKIKANDAIKINQKDINVDLSINSVFFSLNKSKLNNQKEIKNEDYHNSKVAWRANIKLKNKFCSSSYQGEYPGSMVFKNISLVSCSPMIQKNENIKNYFYLVNLSNNPQKRKFEIDILSSKKEKIMNFDCYTNTSNCIDLKKLSKNYNSDMYIFVSKTGGGIPIYFSTNNAHKMSLEHTHPPTEYVLHGNRFTFQKIKKNFWKL